MDEKEMLFEKYRREMLEMQKRAKCEAEKTVEITEEETASAEEKPEEIPEEKACDEQPNTEPEEAAEEEQGHDIEEENLQNDGEPPFCRLCGGKIALCEFRVESTASGIPIENAQIMLYRDDGFFIRALTDENGQTCEIPIFADRAWRISVTAEGHISVSKAAVEPIAGEKISVPVKLDESLSLNDIFTEHRDDILGA